MQNINVIIPAGGEGIRFIEKGYTVLKPFIHFDGLCMFEHLIDGLKSTKYNVRILIIIQSKFKDKYSDQIENIMDKYNNVKFAYIPKITEGTTATALHFYDFLNTNDMLLLMNCDQIIDLKLDDFIDKVKKYDGSLLVFDNENSNKWSYVKFNEKQIIEVVVAKEAISNFAVCGWYFWTKSLDFIKYGIMQIVNLDKVNNEYYLCPSYNYAIQDNKKIFAYTINRAKMHGVGTPADLEKYIESLRIELSCKNKNK